MFTIFYHGEAAKSPFLCGKPTAVSKRGERPKVVQSLLGHTSITQTMDTYSHLMEDIGGDAVGGLDETFG